jgi:hypothetical protein
MKNQAPWVGKVFDEQRAGFVAEHGSQRHPLAKSPEPALPPPAPGPSPLDKIIDEDRIGFAEALRVDTAQRAAIVAKLRRRGRKPQTT